MRVSLVRKYDKVRTFELIDELPSPGDDWIYPGYEDANVRAWVEVTKEMEKLDNDPYRYYKLTIEQPDIIGDGFQEYNEYVAIKTIGAKERYDSRTARYFTLKLNRNTDADLIKKLESVGNVQGYIKELIRKDVELESN